MDRRRRRDLARLAILPVLLALLAVVWPALHLGPAIVALRGWIASLGPLAPVVYAVIEGVTMPLMLPSLPLTVGAAALFGPVLGLIVVLVASDIGAALCFLIARYVARDAVVSLFGHREEFRRIERLTATRGPHAVALVRLFPLSPFEPVSYMLGLTAVPFWTYMLWTAIASVPGAVLYVFGSAAVIESAAGGRPPVALLVVFAATLAAAIVLIRVIAREMRD